MDYQKLIKLANTNGFSALVINSDLPDTRSVDINVFDGVVQKNETAEGGAMAISGLYEGQMTTLEVDDLTLPEEWIIQQLKANASIMQSKAEGEIFAGSEHYPEIALVEHDYEKYSTAEKIALCEKLTELIKAREPRTEHVTIYYQEKVGGRKFVNTYNLNLEDHSAYCVIVAFIVLKDGENRQTGYGYQIAHKISEFDLPPLADRIVERAGKMLAAQPIPTGEYDIVIENELMSELLEAYVSWFKGMSVYQKISPLAGKLGEKIMSEKITLTDDPLHPDAFFQRSFDNEGVACFPKDLVKAGVLKHYLLNLRSAKALGLAPTGNGSPDGSAITNLYLEKGTRPVEAIYADVKRGFYITEFEGMHAGINTINGDFSLKAKGFLIENGQLTQAVKLVVLSGNFLEMMRDGVVELANDAKLFENNISAPSVRFRPMQVSGE